MSTLFAGTNPSMRHRRQSSAYPHESNSWTSLLDALLRWSERSRRRASLREIAEDPHLLNDLGLTRDEVLEKANEPFWR